MWFLSLFERQDWWNWQEQSLKLPFDRKSASILGKYSICSRKNLKTKTSGFIWELLDAFNKFHPKFGFGFGF